MQMLNEAIEYMEKAQGHLDRGEIGCARGCIDLVHFRLNTMRNLGAEIPEPKPSDDIPDEIIDAVRDGVCWDACEGTRKGVPCHFEKECDGFLDAVKEMVDA